ncbi:MAG: hypothetical protein DHS20C12_14880 [Pseudohongiella sp.]|nr:MAG: hypothetical protein DHS20C12_14880 [Pseudohongiella sp.]
MRNLLLILLLGICQFSNAAENDPPAQDNDQQDAAQASPEPNQELQEDEGSLIAAEVLETNDNEEETSARFIPTEEISQDLGVSFPVDI